jgi:secreted PhoX family phosphatase
MTEGSNFSRSAKPGEFSDDIGANPTDNATMGDIIAERMSRRDLAKGLLAVSAIAAVEPALEPVRALAANASTTPSFNFTEIKAGIGTRHLVAEGYYADILIRWGDKVVAGAPAFDLKHQSGASQAKQFGYNNDFIGYIPLDPRHRDYGFGGGSGPSDHGLLVVNHEYTDLNLMFAKSSPVTKQMVDVEIAAHGGSVLEVKKTGGRWKVVDNSIYGRRITGTTSIRLSGPAAGHDKLKTSADPTGTALRGMLNNCAGGITPWGTWLTGEENFNGYFSDPSSSLTGHPNEAAFRRYGVPGNFYSWAGFYDRFDIAKEPNEANRFGWIVEIDPFDPTSTPIKRTALGRFKHEGAESIVNRDGRVAFYMGDDERFDYVYKFVTRDRLDTLDRAKNRDLLDHGTLYVAKFSSNGRGVWLPLVHGRGPLTAANGFADQGDVLINTRLAADLLGATKMDRPEDVEANPKTGKIYVALTNNSRRTADQVDAANPRASNLYGHIIEIQPDGGDHAGTTFTWNILVKCGNHLDPAVGASFNPATTADGWFGMPDMLAVDPNGRLWVGTDGQNANSTGRADGLWAIETKGAARATAKHFFRCPTDAEMCGPRFTPDLETLFLAVQHPGEGSTFANPSTRWPDFKDGVPPRPSIVAITKKSGGKIA